MELLESGRGIRKQKFHPYHSKRQNLRPIGGLRRAARRPGLARFGVHEVEFVGAVYCRKYGVEYLTQADHAATCATTLDRQLAT